MADDQKSTDRAVEQIKLLAAHLRSVDPKKRPPRGAFPALGYIPAATEYWMAMNPDQDMRAIFANLDAWAQRLDNAE